MPSKKYTGQAWKVAIVKRFSYIQNYYVLHNNWKINVLNEVAVRLQWVFIYVQTVPGPPTRSSFYSMSKVLLLLNWKATMVKILKNSSSASRIAIITWIGSIQQQCYKACTTTTTPTPPPTTTTCKILLSSSLILSSTLPSGENEVTQKSSFYQLLSSNVQKWLQRLDSKR